MNDDDEIIGYMAWEPELGLHDFDVGKTYTAAEAHVNCNNDNRKYEGLYLTVGSPMTFPEYSACASSFFGEYCTFYKVSFHNTDVLNSYGNARSVDKVTILEKFTRDEIIDRQIEIAKNSPWFHKFNNENGTIATGLKDAKLLLSGHGSTAATSGAGAVIIDGCISNTLYGEITIASAGKCSAIASLASYASLALAGKLSFIQTMGDCSSVATSGAFVELLIKSSNSDVAVSGDYSAIKSTAKEATIAIAGSYSNSSIDGEDNVIAIVGKEGRFKGVTGTPVCVADYGEDGKCRGFVTGRIGENSLKPDTIYTVKNGQFIEASVVDEAYNG